MLVGSSPRCFLGLEDGYDVKAAQPKARSVLVEDMAVGPMEKSKSLKEIRENDWVERLRL